MPLPLILGIGAAVAGTAGVGAAGVGAVKMKKAKDTMQSSKERHDDNMKYFESENKITNTEMDKLGSKELDVLESFGRFSDVFEQIKNRPQFDNYTKSGVQLPKYDGEKIKEVSVGAGALLGGLGGAGLGTAGGFAAAGAAQAAVMAVGTASTGTAISTLSGAALTNATLAALGGGSIAAGGGGMALGTTILGATTLGVGLLVGGVIFNFTGSKISNKAEEASKQVKEAEIQINNICTYLLELRETAKVYHTTLNTMYEMYKDHLSELNKIVNVWRKKDWNNFTQGERRITQNTVLLVGLLYEMCKVELVVKSTNNNEPNKVNIFEIKNKMQKAANVYREFK